MAFPGGASPSSQRNRKTGLEGLAQCPATVSGAKWLPTGRGEALLWSGSPPPSRPTSTALLPREQVLVTSLCAKCLAWAWQSGWS